MSFWKGGVERSNTNIPNIFYEFSFVGFITGLLSDINTNTFKLGSVIAWSIWKSINYWLFYETETRINIDNILQQAMLNFNEYKERNTISSSLNKNERHTSSKRPQRWTAPPEHYHKINVDGSCIKGQLLAAAVIWDILWKTYCKRHQISGYWSAHSLRGHAFLLEMEMITKFNLHKVVVEGNSELLVKYINDTTVPPDWNIICTIEK